MEASLALTNEHGQLFTLPWGKLKIIFRIDLKTEVLLLGLTLAPDDVLKLLASGSPDPVRTLHTSSYPELLGIHTLCGPNKQSQHSALWSPEWWLICASAWVDPCSRQCTQAAGQWFPRPSLKHPPIQNFFIFTATVEQTVTAFCPLISRVKSLPYHSIVYYTPSAYQSCSACCPSSIPLN